MRKASKNLLPAVLAIIWIVVVFYNIRGYSTASLVFLWLFASAETILFCLTFRYGNDSSKSSKFAAGILFGIAVLVNVLAFFGLIGIDSTKYELIVNQKVIEEWIKFSFYQTLGYMTVALYYFLFLNKLGGWKCRLLVSINVVLMVISIISMIYSVIHQECFVSGTWREWMDYAWFIQSLHFLYLPCFLLVAFGIFLHRLLKNQEW